MDECGWSSESCGALALRWGYCDKMKPSCLRRPTARVGVLKVNGAPPVNAEANAKATASAPADGRDKAAQERGAG